MSPTRQSIAESLLGDIEWTAPGQGFLRCPGADLHSNQNGKRDCIIHIDGAPNLHCVHTSCAAVIVETSRKLQSEIGKVEHGQAGTMPRRKPTREETEQKRREAEAEILRKRAVASKEKILREYAIEPAELCRQSPTSLVGVHDLDLWRQLLRLFQPEAVVWIGDLRDSGPGHEANFRTVEEWLKLPKCPGPRIVPSAFKPGSYSRGKDSVLDRVFLVLESDKLTLREQCAVIQYVRKYCRLRAMVHSGNKSLHAWFQYPPEVCLKQLEIILPEIGIDPAGFNPSQPFRMPGVRNVKSGRFSDLVFLDVEDDE
jgi:hypothetical protein